MGFIAWCDLMSWFNILWLIWIDKRSMNQTLITIDFSLAEEDKKFSSNHWIWEKIIDFNVLMVLNSFGCQF